MPTQSPAISRAACATPFESDSVQTARRRWVVNGEGGIGATQPRVPTFHKVLRIDDRVSRGPSFDSWQCPWVFIPGGACGYLYCPFRRHPGTGAPIQQLVPAPCAAESTEI